MTPVAYGILWYAYLLLVVVCLQRLTHLFTELSLFTVVFGFFLLRYGITVPFDNDVNFTFTGIEMSQVALARFYKSLVVMYAFLVLGIFVGRIGLGSGITNIRRFRAEMGYSLHSGFGAGKMVCFAILTIVLIIFFQINSEVSVWDLLSGKVDAIQYRQNREASGMATHFSLGPAYRLASIARIGLLPMFVATLFLVRNKGLIWKWMFWGMTALGMVAGLLSGQKTPAIFLILAVALAMYLRRGDLRLKRMLMPFVGLALVMLFCALPYLYKIQYPQLDYETRFQLTLFRLTSEYDRSLQLYFQIYPDIKPHTHGMSSTLIRSFLGGSTDEMEPERFIPTYYLGDDYKNTWNAGFIGQAWADWGYWGVAGVSLGLGLLLQVFAVWFRRSKKTALTLGTQVSLMIAGTRLSEVGYTACLLNYGLLSSFLVSFFLRKSKK